MASNGDSAARTMKAPTLEDDLAVRMALATTADTAKGMFFNGVLDAVEKMLGEDAREQCRKASGERKFIDFFNYPIAQFLPMAFTAARLLQPKVGGVDKAFFRLGHQAIEDFLNSGVGKTLLVLAGKDPGRLLAAAPSAYKTAVSYGERRLEQRNGHFVLVVRRDFMPPSYHEGVLVAVLKAMGVADPLVHGRSVGVLDTDYEVVLSPNGGKP